jgi:hypothetical protein
VKCAHDLFKGPDMLKRFKELRSIGAKEREQILFALDSMSKKCCRASKAFRKKVILGE